MGKQLLIVAVGTFISALAIAIAAGFARSREARTTEPLDEAGALWAERLTHTRGVELRRPRYRRKGRVMATKFITMKHLRSGNATRAEWTQVIATMVAIGSFGAIFFCIAWLISRRNPIVAVAAIVIPALWLMGALREIWTDWRTAKPGEGVTADVAPSETRYRRR